MIRRHPHVFGDMAGELQAHGLQAVEGLWDRIKTQEKQDKAAGNNAGTANGALAGVPVALPALTRALKLQTKASKVGFDWNDPRAVLRKIREETDEIEAELDNPLLNPPPQAGEGWVGAAAAEVGDLLFAAVNLARHLRADPEAVLRETNRKFERRFASIENALAARGKVPQDSTLAEMDALWDAAKRSE
jgi:nucleoside triphosphate diphosphatase